MVVDIDAIAWAYQKLQACGIGGLNMDSAMMMDRLQLMLLQADEGPGEEDGPWAEGYAERAGLPKPPAGYTAEELEKDNPFNQWMVPDAPK